MRGGPRKSYGEVFLSYHAGPRNQTQVLGLGSKPPVAPEPSLWPRMFISCFLCSLTPGSQGLSTRQVSQESSLDLGPVYSSSQITRAQTKGNGEKVARASFNGSTQGNHWCREGEHSLVPATSSALGRPSSCRPRHTLPLLAESSGSSKAQLQTGTSAVGWISHDTRPQHACHYAGTSRKAWHTPAGQLPPDQLWEDPSSGPPCRPSYQTQVPTAGAGPQSLLLLKALPSSPAV